MFAQINLENDEYLWLRLFLDYKVISLKRKCIDAIARRYNLEPSQYKNKRLLMTSIITIWDTYFKDNIQFKEDYENKFGCSILKDIIIRK